MLTANASSLISAVDFLVFNKALWEWKDELINVV